MRKILIVVLSLFIYSYYGISDGTSIYSIYDPRSSGDGMCSMDASTRTFTNSDCEVFIWDDGYITNVN